MKALLFAILVLTGADLAINHGAVTHAFFAGLGRFGRGIGEWIFYT